MTNTASIREIRTDFRTVKKKIEEHGEVIITDNGEPAYVLKPVPRPKPKAPPRIDYYARLIKRQPRALTKEQSERFWEEERGSR
ncbi:MAG TPA: type II toxin-antitoxin system Phd/YefM family antitoxin [Verrucomicrobiae bacterium]